MRVRGRGRRHNRLPPVLRKTALQIVPNVHQACAKLVPNTDEGDGAEDGEGYGVVQEVLDDDGEDAKGRETN